MMFLNGTRSCLLLAALVAPALGCGGAAPPPSEPAAPGDTQASSPAAAAKDTGPSGAPSTAAEPSSSPSAPPSASAAPPAVSAPPAEPPPAPLSEAERKELETKCAPLQKAMLKVKTRDPEEALAEALKKPPKMPAAELDRCAALATRQVKLYLATANEVEANVTMTRIVKAAVAAYQQKRALCPSTERPVPPDLERLRSEPYTSTASDWSGAAWTCLGFSMEGQAQRYQYEVRVDPGGKSFRVIARGFSFRGAAPVEITQQATITDKGVEVAPPSHAAAK